MIRCYMQERTGLMQFLLKSDNDLTNPVNDSAAGLQISDLKRGIF